MPDSIISINTSQNKRSQCITTIVPLTLNIKVLMDFIPSCCRTAYWYHDYIKTLLKLQALLKHSQKQLSQAEIETQIVKCID